MELSNLKVKIWSEDKVITEEGKERSLTLTMWDDKNPITPELIDKMVEEAAYQYKRMLEKNGVI